MARSTKKLKVCLCGRHARRTPTAYAAYRPYLSEFLEFVEDSTGADLLIFGFWIDIQDAIKDQKIDKRTKLVVLSEEPLWDTVWTKNADLFATNLPGSNITYYNLNHFTTDIYQFDKFPYFITTDNAYIARYISLFARNSTLSEAELQDIWTEAKISYSFLAERRVGDEHDVVHRAPTVFGLSRYRTLLADHMRQHGALVRGSGWGSDDKRQNLPDWHLDKIALSDRSTKIMSAIENTHCHTYVTEKIYDCFATCSVPIIVADHDHRLHQFADVSLNLFGAEVGAAAKKLTTFLPDQRFASRYIDTIKRLRDSFSDISLLHAERTRVAQRVASYLHLAARQIS
jgi:hypothetical protein